MAFRHFQIVFDNPSATYFSGQSVRGRVIVVLDSPLKILGIVMQFKGEAAVFWDIGNGVTDFTAKETYFEKKIILVDESESTLLDGEYCYPFHLQLPTTLPSSFEGWDKLGYVRYTVKVTLSRQWKLPLECTAPFTVISPLDLNMHPQAKAPAQVTQEKHFCCCCCKSGPLTLVVSLPATGYVSGEEIPVTVEVDNCSQLEVHNVTCKLKKLVSFHAKSPTPSTRTFNFTIHDIEFGPVAVRGSKTWTLPLAVPRLPPSNLSQCSLIDIDYDLLVEAKMAPIVHSNVALRIPLTIGTIPFANSSSRARNAVVAEGATCSDGITVALEG